MTKKTLFLFFFLCVSLFYNTKRETRLDWDVFGYYLYLPAKFIYNDIQLEKKEVWLDPLISKYKTTEGFYQAYKGPQDKYVMKYTMGLSYVYAPFFFIANIAAPMLGYEKDGFSPPYQWMLLIGSLLFSIIGIYFLFKILTRYFSDTIVLATIALLVFGSNYFVMTAYDGLMPHNFVFTFYAILLHYTTKWYKNQKIKYAVVVGLCIGISVLIRPTSVVVAVIPALWGVGNWTELKARIVLLFKNYFHLFVLGAATLLVLLPQFMYWKSVTGEWLYYSYPDEKINFFTPHLSAIFSYKKGWLLYTPLMIFAIIGFINLFKKNRALFFSIFLFFIFNTYLISCWDCWWYGGSFAQRPFVESYVFMAFPLAYFIQSVLTKKWLVLLPTSFALLFCLYLNLFQTKQALSGVIHTSLTTKEYYWKVFLKNEASDEDRRWLEPTQYPDGKDNLDPNINYQPIYNSALVLDDASSVLNSGNAFSKQLICPSGLGYDLKNHYILSSILVDTLETNTSKDITGHIVVCINKNGQLYEYRAHDFAYQDLINSSGKSEFTVLLPPQANGSNYEIKSYVYIDEDKKMKLLALKNTILIIN
ncbi:hypothetical protein BH10BAC1_BH10BAC1_00080 [soil metagenome]